MFGSLLFPFGHLLLDDPWIDSIAARFDLLLLHFPKQTFVPRLKRLGRPRIAFRQTALEDLEAPRKRKSIRVQVNLRGRFKHQRPNHEMGQRQRVQLLDDARRSFAPQVRRFGRTARVLVSLLLIIS